MILKNISISAAVVDLLVFILVTVGLFVDQLTFGAGEGDLFFITFFGLAILFFILPVYIWTLKSSGVSISMLLLVLSIAHLSILILHLTLLRGGMYRWDGNIFIA